MQDSSLILKKKLSKLDLIFALLFVSLCGFTSGSLIPGKTYVLFFLGIFALIKRKEQGNRSLYPLKIFIVFIVVVFVHHYLIIKKIDDSLLICLQQFLAAWGFFLYMGPKARYAIFKIMVMLSTISLFCFGIVLVTGRAPHIEFLNTAGGMYKGIFLWNSRLNEIRMLRNCGPFWEPGAFAGYILMTFLLYFSHLKQLWRQEKRSCYVLGLALITTFSSQGYLALFAFGIIKILMTTNKKNVVLICACLFFVCVVGSVLFFKVQFLGDKLKEQIELSKDYTDVISIESSNRFTTAMIDLDNIASAPLFGRTGDVFYLYDRFPLIIKIIERKGHYGSGSGMTCFIASHGIILWLVWLLLSYRSLRDLYRGKKEAGLVLATLVFLGEGEQYLNWIFYLSIPFWLLTKDPCCKNLSPSQSCCGSDL